MSSQTYTHIFLVAFPSQGHVNPLLRLGKILASKGHLVTLSAPELIGKEIRKANRISDDQPTNFGKGMIRFEFFDDEWEVLEDGSKANDFDSYTYHLEQTGMQKLSEMLKKHEQKGSPVSCLINDPFLPWVFDVADSLRIPSATLWVQSCASFSAHYHYHCGLVTFPTESEPGIDVQLPGMPVLKYNEIPTILHSRNPSPFVKKAILASFKNFSKNFCILMDTFYELENEIIDHMAKLCPIKPIGPMFKIPNDSSTEVSGDITKADDCKEWLDSKPASSVVYISFGSVVFLKQEQVTELAYGIMTSGVNFLWVLRPPAKGTGSQPHVLPDELLENSPDKGKVVQWSPQEQVLAHPSIACFITHCGWNSTLEAITSGVPVVAFPQWGDQVTNAKYLVEEFKIGVRLSRGHAENMIVTRDQVEKCVREIIDGPNATEIKENASQWKKKAETSINIGGSSKTNIDSFLDQVAKICEIKGEPQVSSNLV